MEAGPPLAGGPAFQTRTLSIKRVPHSSRSLRRVDTVRLAAPGLTFQKISEEAIAPTRRAKKRQPPVAAAGDKVQVMNAVSTMQPERHKIS
jgi:hypothetical protein